MTNNNSHRHCTHEATKAARAACRKLRAQGQDTTAGLETRVTHALHRAFPDHNLYCCWHAVSSYSENYQTSKVEDPTAAWCAADEPTDAELLSWSSDGVGDMCRCDDSPEVFVP